MERYANEFISVFAEEYIEETKYRKNEVLENILNIIMCVVNTTPQKSVKEINIMSGNIINFISYSHGKK